MIVLFTDFGWRGPYVGQLKAELCQRAPHTPVIDLMHDAPPFNPRAAAYLLASLVGRFPENTVFLAVVDPGVGTQQRRPCVVEADGRWYVGPDNGLFNIVAKHARQSESWEIIWQPQQLSASFHGRDLFAPVAAQLAEGIQPSLKKCQLADDYQRWPDDLAEVIYIDNFGNAITGLRAASLAKTARLSIGEQQLTYAKTFAEVPENMPFWYVNSSDLVEIAVNRNSAAERLGLVIGSRLGILD